jgi:hypothetical protein
MERTARRAGINQRFKSHRTGRVRRCKCYLDIQHCCIERFSPAARVYPIWNSCGQF